MKKILLILIVILLSFTTCCAQSHKVRRFKGVHRATPNTSVQSGIKRTYLGLTIGRSKRVDAINYAKNNKYKWADEAILGYVLIKKVNFANLLCDDVFIYYNNKDIIKGIQFTTTYYDFNAESSYRDYNSLRQQFLEKYKKYCTRDTIKSTSRLFNLDEGKFSVSLYLSKAIFVENGLELSLHYNLDVLEQKNQSDDL